MNTIIISCDSLTPEDVQFLNGHFADNECGLEVFLSTRTDFHLTSSTLATLLFVFQESILNNAVYDGIKFSIIHIINKLKKNSKSSGATIEICLNGKKDTLYFDFELSESQKEKVIDASIRKFLDE